LIDRGATERPIVSRLFGDEISAATDSGVMVDRPALRGRRAGGLVCPRIFSKHTLVLGDHILLDRAAQLTPQVATLVLATSGLVLAIKWGQPFSALLIALEALWVGWRWRKGANPIVADLIFWGLVGTPASWFLYSKVSPIPHPSFEYALVVQVINGNIAVWAAVAGLSLIPAARPRSATAENLGTFLLKRYLIVGTFPLLIGGMIAAHQYEKMRSPRRRAAKPQRPKRSPSASPTNLMPAVTS
jgi:hypothetical protein